MGFKSCTLALYVLFRVICCVVGGFEDQAKILATNGHIIIESAQDRNITFYMKGRGHLNFGGLSVEQVLRTLSKMMIEDRSSTDRQAFLPGGSVADQVQLLATYVNGPFGLIKRVETLEQESSTRNTTQMYLRIGALARRVKHVETKLATLMTELQANRCASGPCQNGGTCIAQYDAFVCLCPSNWEGQTCTTDVNECALFAGTDLGCQNGATCINIHGGYNCMCTDGWLGIHCNTRSQDCSTAGSDLCGHGTCVQARDGYRCICDQGWKTNGATLACSLDMDECSESKPHCSKDPEVSCINLPGSFVCGPCPTGYTGNGFYCVDIDECETNNGGCSTSPSVPCINTRGSNRCGNCPTGYTRDGRTCVAQQNRCTQGLCHTMARCVDYGSAVPNCICLPGYTGSGFGPNGCYRSSMNPCASAPCRNGGTCVKIDAHNYSCTCPPDTSPPNCMRTTSPCDSNPCQNGATCVADRGTTGWFGCRCPPGYTGLRCQTSTRTCGGVLYQLIGTLRYPEFNGTYNHNARCAWLIKTNDTQVLDITFTHFDLENSVSSGECKHDWLQLHDGRTSAAQIIGRFCGNELPRGGNFQSTHNMLYLWFRSDNATAHDGFELQWKSVAPVCGGSITVVSHGIITSPGTPGNYPPNRDCKWFLQAPPGRRIQFTFFTIMIEVHENCNYDFVQISEGVTDEGTVLAKYCNTTHPPPLITTTHEATVYFHSDESSNDAGFQINYAVVEGVPGCGGTYTQREGVISSPLSQTDNVYPNNLNCEYLVKLPIGSRVEIKFNKFHLQQSEGCKLDYLEIVDGSSMDDDSLGKFCGDRLPPTFTSTGNSLLLKFHTDWSAPNPGFSVVYKMKCGGIFDDPAIAVMSPSYPQMYLAGLLCDYVIHAPFGKAISFDFQDFDIEQNSFGKCELDYVELYDGPLATNETLLGRYCSTKSPPTIISSKNVLLLRFVSDGSGAGRGFKGNFSFFDVSCGGVLMREDIIIRSPMIAETGKYQHGAECEWIIVAPEGHAIQLTWRSFELELSGQCVYDYVQVFDNSSMANSLVGRYCGTDKPPVITSTGNMVTIRFVTTDSTSSKDGFSLSFNFIDVEKSCGGNYFATSGIVRSPGWPKNYLPNKVCEWVITVPMGQQITLLVHSFRMEKHKTCRFDGLTIRNGGTQHSPLIGVFCGEDDFNGTISFNHQLYLRFYSDSSHNYEGFMIEWDSVTTGCGGVLTSPRGSIISPNYPLPYGQNALCIWRISMSAGSAIHLMFVDMDMESHKDCQHVYLDIYDGADMGGRKLGRFCSAATNPIVLDTESNHALIRMRTDETNQRRGFQLKYSIICRRNITGFGGVIESPNFPNEYAASMDCRWTIQVPPGNNINLEFSHFDFESINQHGLDNATHQHCPFDYVEVQEMLSRDLPVIRRFCADKPVPFVSLGRSIDLVFHTDARGERMGFRAEWSIHGCGGLLTKPYGTFSSPNYPDQYPMETECHWTIRVEPGKRVDLTVEDFHMETNDQCQFDGLQIANDANFTHQVTKICHQQQKPVHLVSSGMELFVKFYSDSTFSYKGFRAVYSEIDSQCGGRITLHQGFISSPNYPSNYPANASCSWLIETDVSHTLQLTIKSLAIERSANCTNDSLQVFDGASALNRVLLTGCGSEANVGTVSTCGHRMLVTFESNDIIEAKGFHAEFRTNCGSRIEVKWPGNILINNAHNMPQTDNCTWVLIASEPTQRITITIVDMNVMDNDGDCFASLTVFEGDGPDGPKRFEGCGHKIPPAIVSRGNALTVLLSSAVEQLNKINNLYVAITYTTLDNACGGSLTALMGEFSSPNYPETYPRNVECVWELSASPGNKMTLFFKEVDIDSTDDCNGDYLEVREQYENGPLLGDFCGNQIPTNLTVANSFWVKFRSNEADVAKGFLAGYSYDMLSEITGTSGTITSPLYPRSYARTDNIGWRITVDMGSVIAMNFNRFAIDRHTDDPELCAGTLVIYDGYDETAAPLLKDCGYLKPAPLTSTSSIVYIVLDHSELIESSLFMLNWQRKIFSNVPSSPVDPCNGHATIVLNSSNATFNLSSPGYPDGYKFNLDCTWIFQSTMPTYHPFLSFELIDLVESSVCLEDYVEVFNSSDLAEWKSFGRICTFATRGTYNFHGTPHLKLEFRTDYIQNRTGFTGTVFLRCGGLLTDPNGIITQPDSLPMVEPGMLVNRTETYESCNWTINVRTGWTIEFNFAKLNITIQPAGPHVSNGYVAIMNGMDEFSPLLGQYSGTDIPGTINTSSNHAFIQYRPSSSGPNLFELVYREVSVECGGNVVLSAQFNSTDIMTPNYPEIPPAHSECFWRVLAPAGQLLRVQVVGQMLLPYMPQCKTEYIQMRAGLTSNAPELLHSCSSDLSQRIMTSTNALSIKYFNDRPDPNAGIKLRVTLAKCGVAVRGAHGSITSKNYPQLGGYPAPAVCEYYIQEGVYGMMMLSFEDLHLPAKANCSSEDNVRIFSILPGINETEYELGKFCGNEVPKQPIVSVVSHVKIVFTATTMNTIYRGFKLNYALHYSRCGQSFVADLGEISSPGYGEELQAHAFCEWRITVPAGRRIKVVFVDLDIQEQSVSDDLWLQRLSFFDGGNYEALIKQVTSNDKSIPIYSSDNRMLIQYASRVPIGKLGFRLRYSSDEPSICDGNLDGWQGSITTPSNETTIVCTYKRTEPTLSHNPRTQPNVGTLAMMFREVHAGIEPFESTCVQIMRAAIYRGESRMFNKMCQNATNEIVLSPFHNIMIRIEQPYTGMIWFKMDYRVHQCGGVYGAITNISRPLGFEMVDSDGLHCAWYVSYPDQTLITIAFEQFQMQLPCTQEYLLVYNGPGPKSPLLGRFCKGLPPPAETIATQKHLLFVEYHTAQANVSDKIGAFELRLGSKNFGCGGTLHPRTSTFGAPLKDGKYLPMQECVWLLQANAGSHIGARFINRFNLEKSPNCTKDYVELFDQRRNWEWVSLGRVCGKEVPPYFNSSGTMMKVVFRTDDTREADGFTIKWESLCGGIFYAEQETNVIVSPNYPEKYNNLQVCNYTILANSSNDAIVFQFLDFELEDSLETSHCAYDNLTFYQYLRFDWDYVGTYCHKNPPARFRVKDRAAFVFRTDRFLQARGFRFEYRLDTCGANITSSMRIQTPEHLLPNDFNRPALSCRWYIDIPQGQKVTVRFEMLEIEHTESCSYDTVEVFRGLEANHRLALLCGNLTGHAPAISISGTRHGMISFEAKSRNPTLGKMSALVLYTPDCDKRITLDDRSPSYRLNVIGSGNKHVQDCQYVFQAPSGYTLQLAFDQFHVGSARNATLSNCTDDFVELRDGGSIFSVLIGRFCGNHPVSPQTTFGATMHLRYVTDSALRGTLFDATVYMVPSLCGPMRYNLTGGAIMTLNTPNFGGNNSYPPSTKCLWLLEASEGNHVEIQFRTMDLQQFDENSRQCKDYIGIRDVALKSAIYEGLDHSHIFNGGDASNASFYRGTRYANTYHVYCGNHYLPSTYISIKNRVYISFESDASIEAKGVSLLVHESTLCAKNYTALQGRVVQTEIFQNQRCTITVQVPENYTIALYFNTFEQYFVNCAVQSIKFYGGPEERADQLLAEICGFNTPNPIFTTGNFLRIVLPARIHRITMVKLDATYVATDQGQGCGGELYNYGGVFSSPLYPANSRTWMECLWTVKVPDNLLVALHFDVFDLGSKSSCATDYLQILDRSDGSNVDDANAEKETVVRQHCGGDKPAIYISSGSMVRVRYKRTQNFAGVGWMIQFMGIEMGADAVVQDSRDDWNLVALDHRRYFSSLYDNGFF